MTKKDTVRKFLLTLRTGDNFTITGLAKTCKVSAKDVTNVTIPMFKAGIFERKLINGVYLYKVDANALNLYSSKYPTEYHGEIKGAVIKQVPKTNGARKMKRRSPAVMEIDSKIAIYHDKINSLKAMRKEFI